MCISFIENYRFCALVKLSKTDSDITLIKKNSFTYYYSDRK